MSVNLGNDAVLALHRLKDNLDFQKFVIGFGDFVHDEMHKALDAQPEHVVYAQNRARAFRDLWTAMTGGVRGQKPTQVDKKEVHKGKPLRAALPTEVFKTDTDTDGLL